MAWAAESTSATEPLRLSDGGRHLAAVSSGGRQCYRAAAKRLSAQGDGTWPRCRAEHGNVIVKVVPSPSALTTSRRAAVGGGDGLGDGQPEAHAGDGVALRGGRPEEAGEQLALLPGRDAHAGVAHRQLGHGRGAGPLDGAHLAVRRLPGGAQRQGDPAAGRGELHGVGDEVVAGLSQPDGVTGDDQAVRRHVDADLDPGGVRGDPDRLLRRADDGRQVDVLGLEREPAGLDLGGEQQVTDEPLQPVGVALDRRQVLALVGRERAGPRRRGRVRGSRGSSSAACAARG